MNDSLVDLRDLPQEALIHFVKSLGQPAFRGRQLLPWLYRPSRIDFADMSFTLTESHNSGAKALVIGVLAFMLTAGLSIAVVLGFFLWFTSQLR